MKKYRKIIWKKDYFEALDWMIWSILLQCQVTSVWRLIKIGVKEPTPQFFLPPKSDSWNALRPLLLVSFRCYVFSSHRISFNAAVKMHKYRVPTQEHIQIDIIKRMGEWEWTEKREWWKRVLYRDRFKRKCVTKQKAKCHPRTWFEAN